jgi:hypothetical protein
MLRNCDGTPLKLGCGSGESPLAQFDPENPDLNLFNSFDAEIIDIAGSPIFYYELFIQKQTIDPLYREDRGKIWSITPIELKGYYEPITSQNYVNMFGTDAPDEMKFEFNYREVLKKLGHPPKLGSRLFTPHKRENWVIVQRNVGEFRLWGELRLLIIAQRFQESVTTKEGAVTQGQVQPPFNLNQGALFTENSDSPKCK